MVALLIRILSILFRILLFIVGIGWLIKQFSAAKSRPSKKTQTQSPPPTPATNTVKDPICGMYIDPRLAVRIENKNETLYFCSEQCKKKFLDTPLA